MKLSSEKLIVLFLLMGVGLIVFAVFEYPTEDPSDPTVHQLSEMLKNRTNNLLSSNAGELYRNRDFETIQKKIKEPKNEKEREAFFKTSLLIFDRNLMHELTGEELAKIYSITVEYLLENRDKLNRKSKASLYATRLLGKLPMPVDKSENFKSTMRLAKFKEPKHIYTIVLETTAKWVPLPFRVKNEIRDLLYSKDVNEVKLGIQSINLVKDSKAKKALLSELMNIKGNLSNYNKAIAIKTLSVNSQALGQDLTADIKNLVNSNSEVDFEVFVGSVEKLENKYEFKNELQKVITRSNNSFTKQRAKKILSTIK